MGYFPCDLVSPAARSNPAIEWEEPDCLLCGSRRWLPLVEAPDETAGGSGLWFAVVQCQECGLCFTNPRPSADSIGQFYPGEYAPHRPRVRASRRWRLTNQASDLPAWHGQGRLLDFGCGGGGFLHRMHQHGWQVTGIDASATAVHHARADLGLNVLTGTLPHPKLESASFDVITMRQSLEHVHEPLEVLRAAHQLLVRGGKLIVIVPNIDSLPFRWFGNVWYGLDVPRHLTHFAPWTLQLMLQQAGFHAGPIRMVPHASWTRRSATRIGSRSGGRFWQRWLTGRLASGLAVRYSCMTEQADCIALTAER